MNMVSSIPERFQRLLDDQSELANALARLLDREQEALAAPDLAVLENVTREKIDLALRFEHLENERRTLLERAGIDPESPDAVRRWMKTLDASGGLERRWQILGDRLRQCRERNRRIGHALRLHRNRTEAALRVLSGESAESTYSASGTSTAPGAGMRRNLGSA